MKEVQYRVIPYFDKVADVEGFMPQKLDDTVFSWQNLRILPLTDETKAQEVINRIVGEGKAGMTAEEITEVKSTIALLSSMVDNGEQHSFQSLLMKECAYDILNKIKSEREILEDFCEWYNDNETHVRDEDVSLYSIDRYFETTKQ